MVGSVSQEDDWRQETERLTQLGYVVFEAGSYDKSVPQKTWDLIEEVHLQKILMSDIVAVIPKKDGTVGKSTQKEIEFARINGRSVTDVSLVI